MNNIRINMQPTEHDGNNQRSLIRSDASHFQEHPWQLNHRSHRRSYNCSPINQNNQFSLSPATPPSPSASRTSRTCPLTPSSPRCAPWANSTILSSAGSTPILTLLSPSSPTYNWVGPIASLLSWVFNNLSCPPLAPWASPSLTCFGTTCPNDDTTTRTKPSPFVSPYSEFPKVPLVAALDRLVEHVKFLIAQLHIVDVLFQPRVGSKVAHSLAQVGMRLQHKMFWEDMAPFGILPLLDKDREVNMFWFCSRDVLFLCIPVS
ncbi:hypothetical protein GBA52_011461 [Prunus armeniaca]|nr:hypothetical protein GBA52_011461 [Prunus armeniaca]